MTNQTNTHVTTGRVRLSYVALVEPKLPLQAKPGDKPKYQVTLLIPKSDIATKQRIDAAVEAAAQAGVSKCWQGNRPPRIDIPVHDGDGGRPSDGAPYGEECRGCWVISASNVNQPKIVDAALNPIIDATQIYSGMYGRVGVDFYPYSNTKKGVGCSLGNVQKLEDGEPLAGRSASVEDDFGDGYGAQYPQPVAQPVNPPYGAAQSAAAPVYYQPPMQPAPGAPRFNPLTGQYE